MIAAQRKYRHGQSALHRKQFVVGRMLRECCELIKFRMQAPGRA
jgi:hypothetical protein